MVLYLDILGKEYSDLIVNVVLFCEDISYMICLCFDYFVLGIWFLDEVIILINEYVLEIICIGGI